jgi:regulator of sirC expression with transglutaminase-like and TPR domain
MRRYDDAMADVQRSLLLLPNDPHALSLRARLHDISQHEELALADYRLVTPIRYTYIHTNAITCPIQ